MAQTLIGVVRRLEANLGASMILQIDKANAPRILEQASYKVGVHLVFSSLLLD